MKEWTQERMMKTWERLLVMYWECIEALGTCTPNQDVEIEMWTKKADQIAGQISNVRNLIVAPLPGRDQVSGESNVMMDALMRAENVRNRR